MVISAYVSIYELLYILARHTNFVTVVLAYALDSATLSRTDSTLTLISKPALVRFAGANPKCHLVSGILQTEAYIYTSWKSATTRFDRVFQRCQRSCSARTARSKAVAQHLADR